MIRSRRPLALLAVALAALTGAVLAAVPAAAAPLPTAVVALGDSAASGDGAGDYVPGTRGEGGNWCHRSAHAYVHRSGLAEESVNLACSGAHAVHVGFGGPPHHTERSQAERLVEVARRHRVTVVTVQAGANDAGLVTAGVDCVRAFVDPRTPPCRTTLGPDWPGRVAAAAAGVESAVRDVREAMRRAGYSDTGYTLVLASYASPVTERMVPVHGVRGCPYSRADAAWGREVAFPALSEALRGVAERTDARFLDLHRAAEGREACSRVLRSEEWQRRITVDPQALVHGGLGGVGRLFQESFHPNAAGHAEIGRCLAEFVRSAAPRAACVAGGDGRLRAAVEAPASPRT